MECIDDLREPPVVGKYYSVPHVFYRYAGRDPRWWPVIGPKHDDAEHLKFTRPHYHLDIRFVRLVMLRVTDWRNSPWFDLAARPISEVEDWGPLPQPEYRKAKCKVSDAGFPSLAENGMPTFNALHDAYQGKRCGRDGEGRLVCPHKGAILSNLPPDRHGRVLCPLHGLMIDAVNGVVVPRPRVPTLVRREIPPFKGRTVAKIRANMP
jgi:hypothetical protein